MGIITKKKQRGGSMSNGYILIFCIIVFTSAIATLFFIKPQEPKRFDKQGMVKYNDNDY